MTGYLTVTEVAERFGVSMRSVQRWIERSELPAVRLPGGLLRVRLADVEAFEDQRLTVVSAGRRLSPLQSIRGGA
jgi:excisionase family DNA binding protein